MFEAPEQRKRVVEKMSGTVRTSVGLWLDNH